jgi:3-hydroxyacyl-[acyl-carrier-protein] dehydratase
MTKFDTPINVEGIMKLIPHRYPFLLIDRVEEMVAGESATVLKNVTINEPFFTGHFPGKPIMPGVLILEAMAQAAAVFVSANQAVSMTDKLVYFTSIEEAKFLKPVVPGDVLSLHVKKLRAKLNLWKIQGEAFVKGIKVSEAMFSAMLVENK